MGATLLGWRSIRGGVGEGARCSVAVVGVELRRWLVEYGSWATVWLWGNGEPTPVESRSGAAVARLTIRGCAG
jgi:hypothetical protein